MALGLFWVSVAWLAYVYAGYPLALWLIALPRRFASRTREDYFPGVSVLVAAHNEEKDIAWKVSETLSWNYPAGKLELIVASDASDDRTDEILQGFRDSRLKYIRMETRAGKNGTLNHISQLARCDVLFFTDANTHIGADCLQKMTRHFADPRVGCVTGMEKTLQGGADPAVPTGAKNYLEYEFRITSLESRLGSVLVCDGSIFCVRRELFVSLDPDLANDLELPLHIANKGYAVLCEPSARSTERAAQSAREEFNRKRRIGAQGLLGFWRLRRSIRGLRRWQFLSHKLLRWLGLVPMSLILVATTVLMARPFFAFLLVLQIAFYSLALLGPLFDSTRPKVRSLLTFPFYFLLVNLAAIVGIFEACAGRRFAVWEVAALSRGQQRA